MVELFKVVKHGNKNGDSGKSTILEALSIVATGELNGYAFDKQIKANYFNDSVSAII